MLHTKNICEKCFVILTDRCLYFILFFMLSPLDDTAIQVRQPYLIFLLFICCGTGGSFIC